METGRAEAGPRAALGPGGIKPAPGWRQGAALPFQLQKEPPAGPRSGALGQRARRSRPRRRLRRAFSLVPASRSNTEFTYLLHEAEELGHTIGGNTNHGSNADNPQEKGVVYDSAGRTLTGCDPLTWSHDGTTGGVFGICGNFWEFVTGLRLHKGVVEYTKDNDAAVEGYKDEAPDWTVAEVNGKPLKLYGSSGGGVVMSTAEKIEKDWDGCHIARIAAGRVGRRAGNCLYQAGDIFAAYPVMHKPQETYSRFGRYRRRTESGF